MTDHLPRLLIVEDDLDLSHCLKFIFESHGYEVLQAPDSSTGIKILENIPVSLIISDIQMKHEYGFKLFNYLEKHHPHTPLIICSGYIFEFREQLLAATIMDKTLIDKPFNFLSLLEEVKTLLGQ
jgi:DNA-binding response OmpR family regulator